MSAQEELKDALKEAASDTPQTADGAKTRVRSTIEFPYSDLDDAVAVAKGVHSAGGSSCSMDQLAPHLNQETASSGFRLSLNTARIFGLVQYAQNTITLTPLGTSINDPQKEVAAKSEAFLRVPLYRAVYDQFKGTLLPPISGLETAMANLGVASKQADKARQVFQRSATQAGFFAHGANRLVPPSVKGNGEGHGENNPPPDETKIPKKGGGSGDDGGSQHPFIQGLIKTLPKTEGPWAIEKRAQWLQAAVSVFNLIYTDEGSSNSTIEIAIKKGSTLS